MPARCKPSMRAPEATCVSRRSPLLKSHGDKKNCGERAKTGQKWSLSQPPDFNVAGHNAGVRSARVGRAKVPEMLVIAG